MRSHEFDKPEKFVDYRSGNLDLKISSHVYDRNDQYRVSNRVLNLALSKLKMIEKQLDELEPGQAVWALDPTTGLSLGIRKLHKKNHYLVGTARRHRTYDTQNRPVIAMPRGDFITKEQLDELTFLGSQCTKDCSGHRAGYGWYQQKQRDPQSWSPSFNKGAALAKSGK